MIATSRRWGVTFFQLVPIRDESTLKCSHDRKEVSMKKKITLGLAALAAVATPLIAWAGNGGGCCSSLCPFC